MSEPRVLHERRGRVGFYRIHAAEIDEHDGVGEALVARHTGDAFLECVDAYNRWLAVAVADYEVVDQLVSLAAALAERNKTLDRSTTSSRCTGPSPIDREAE